jgi:hypothetical protein
MKIAEFLANITIRNTYAIGGYVNCVLQNVIQLHHLNRRLGWFQMSSP